jgi:transposase-like protein
MNIDSAGVGALPESLHEPKRNSNVTDAVVEEVKVWQSRPLEELYPIVYLDAMMVVRDSGHVQNP